MTNVENRSASSDRAVPVTGLWGVRYQVRDVKRSATFYREQLGFNLDKEHLPAFAQVSTSGLKLILSGPGASGSREMPDGRQQEPGGWNRVMLRVKDLPATVAGDEESRDSLAERNGSRPGRQADTDRGSRRQSDRAVRARRLAGSAGYDASYAVCASSEACTRRCCERKYAVSSSITWPNLRQAGGSSARTFVRRQISVDFTQAIDGSRGGFGCKRPHRPLRPLPAFTAAIA